MKVILNNFSNATTFRGALENLVEGADTLSIAVSYLQIGGWELFRKYTKGINLSKTRIICTDQMGITNPAAIERAIKSEVQIRNFSGKATFHPKVFIAHGRSGEPRRFLIGSANLSSSAFTDSIEAGVLGSEKNSLYDLNLWFNEMFTKGSVSFTAESLEAMKIKWRLAATQRVRRNLGIRRSLESIAGSTPIPIISEDIDTLEDILATIRAPIGLLNMDHAGNNIRTISHLLAVIANFPDLSDKQKSELKLLGMMKDGELTEIGILVASAKDESDVARRWCKWLQNSSDADLGNINPRLVSSKRAMSQFWELREDVQAYFLTNAEQPKNKRLVQTIELLCSAQEIVHELSLEDVKTLAGLLASPRMPEYIKKHVQEYLENKGPRGWKNADRSNLLLAWKQTNR